MSEPDARYTEYNYDTHEIVEYRRFGECCGCGDCCRTLVVLNGFARRRGQDPRRDSYTDDRRGVWGKVEQPGKSDFIMSVLSIGPLNSEKPCPELLPDNRCDIQSIKYRLSAEWPLLPSQVTPFPKCSYAFVEISRRPMHAESFDVRPRRSETIEFDARLGVTWAEPVFEGNGVA